MSKPGTTNKALLGAYRKGREAYAKGASRDQNPYPDVRTSRGHNTFSRAFIRFWYEGWDDAHEEHKRACERPNQSER